MEKKTEGSLVPYELVSPGFEAVYSGEQVAAIGENTDSNGNVVERWPLWTWPGLEREIGPEIEHINRMQVKLGHLDEATRRLRIHIASLAHCDSGIPVTIDELLDAIGRGELPERSFRNGCYVSGGTQSTQPGQGESLRAIHAILTGYLGGKPKEDFISQFPDAAGFINRSYTWLGPVEGLSQVQQLMMERMLLPFEFFIKQSHTTPACLWAPEDRPLAESVGKNCFEDGGRGKQIDAEIAELAGLPEIYPTLQPGKHIPKALETDADTEKREIFRIASALAHGLHTLCDCHHSSFRWIENWVYGIGRLQWGVPTRIEGVERERLRRLLFGYVLALDNWLMGMPMQFLLLDLGHVDIGFDPKNEILRVYAYLGEDKTPVKEWLTACLHWHLHSSLLFRYAHQQLIERDTELGLSLRKWLDSVLSGNEQRR